MPSARGFISPVCAKTRPRPLAELLHGLRGSGGYLQLQRVARGIKAQRPQADARRVVDDLLQRAEPRISAGRAPAFSSLAMLLHFAGAG